ncbi:MAG: 7-cyano-7-deazaguanine synthase QueC [Cyanobacteria bacterium]|nr:7-cyano-7-deazaguanine synthase QueC [Cyanobacteriota bacterium]
MNPTFHNPNHSNDSPKTHLGPENSFQNGQKPRAVALLSGGLDSTVALAKAVEDFHVIQALTFNYGQRAIGRELKASKEIAHFYDVPHQVIALPWLSEHLPAPMAFRSSYDSEMTGKSNLAVLAERSVQEAAQSVWVPNRNGLFLNIAAAIAESHQATHIIFGANAEEAVNFPDNTEDFRDRLNAVFELSTLLKVKVMTPVGDLMKSEIIDLGLALEAPLAMIWSCYGEGPVQCGVCPSCRLLKKAAMDKVSFRFQDLKG